VTRKYHNVAVLWDVTTCSLVDRERFGWEPATGLHLAQDRNQWRALMKTVMHLRVPQSVEKFLGRLATGGFSRTLLHGFS
jgi:hypothetical protein